MIATIDDARLALRQADDLLRERRQRIEELEDALREARSMLSSCALDEPDSEAQASWDRGLEKIDAALQK